MRISRTGVSKEDIKYNKIEPIKIKLEKYAQLITECADKIRQFEYSLEGQKKKCPFKNAPFWYLYVIQSDNRHGYTSKPLNSVRSAKLYKNLNLSPCLVLTFPPYYTGESGVNTEVKEILTQFIDYVKSNSLLSKYLYIDGTPIKNMDVNDIVMNITEYWKEDFGDPTSLVILVSPVSKSKRNENVRNSLKDLNITWSDDDLDNYSVFYMTQDETGGEWSNEELEKFISKYKLYIEISLPFYTTVQSITLDRQLKNVEERNYHYFMDVVIEDMFSFLKNRSYFYPTFLQEKLNNLEDSRLKYQKNY